MKLVFLALGAQYMHTNLAARSLAAVAKAVDGIDVKLLEYTINHKSEEVLRSLYAENGDVYFFSCYIWNVDMMCELGRDLRAVKPSAKLVAGGPQADAHPVDFLRAHAFFDGVMKGEGEENILHYIKAVQNSENTDKVPGYWRNGSEIKCDTSPILPDIEGLPFAYDDLCDVKHRTIYYESMRGCPYKCSYCLSGANEAVRYKSFDKVKDELTRFLNAKVHMVKFVDRTFNCDEKRALDIWKFLAENDNGETGFHFEMMGHALGEESLSFLANVRKGLFQFEIGVQSTNEETIEEIHRPKDQKKLFENVRRLKENKNIHLHLDLIAGLPHEDYDAFVRSFNEVAQQNPHQLQLGFLKVLAGSEMEQKAKEYQLVYREKAPFEVLSTKWISYEQLCRLKDVECMTELYYNSGRFTHTVAYMQEKFDDLFSFWDKLARFYRQNGYFQRPLSKVGQYQLLGEFAKMQTGMLSEKMEWMCRYDMALHEKPRSMPSWINVDGSRPHRNRVLDFYQNQENIKKYLPSFEGKEAKQLLKQLHIEVFPFKMPCVHEKAEEKECAVLFDYGKRDVQGRATTHEVALKF